MAQNHAPALLDADQIERSRHIWSGFTSFMKYSTISVVAIVALLGFFFV